MNGHDEACTPAHATAIATDAAPASQAVGSAYGGASGQDRLAARLAAHYRARRTLFAWMDPARFAGLHYAEHLRGLDDTRAAALAEAFLADAGYGVPSLERFEAADTALAQLSPPAVLSVFRLRALLDHSDELQGWIDRPRRAWLAGWIGATATRFLLTLRRELAGELSPMARRSRAPRLDAQAGDALAWRGLRLFQQECGWDANGPLTILELALPAAAAGLPLAQPEAIAVRRRAHPDATGRHGGVARPATPVASLAIVLQLPALFPEAIW